jgi:RNA polymerase sigma-70 factor (ECF subfamily)
MNRTSDARAAAFLSLYEASYDAIYTYAARRAGVDAADEIAAETFLVAWRRYDAIPAEPLPWLYGVAHNVTLRHHAATGRRRRAQDDLERERPAAAADAGTGDPWLWQAWERLRPGDREVLALIAWEELTVTDAARVLGCSPPVFSVRLHRARRRLQQLLDSPVPSPQLSEATR